jgi:hypothetical protein
MGVWCVYGLSGSGRPQAGGPTKNVQNTQTCILGCPGSPEFLVLGCAAETKNSCDFGKLNIQFLVFWVFFIMPPSYGRSEPLSIWLCFAPRNNHI